MAAALEDPLRGGCRDAAGTAVVLVHKSRRSGLRAGAAMGHLAGCPALVRAESRSFADGGLVTAATVLAPGQKLRVIKFGGGSPWGHRPRDPVGACGQGHATARGRLWIPARAMRSQRRGGNVVTITLMRPRSAGSARAMMHRAGDLQTRLRIGLAIQAGGAAEPGPRARARVTAGRRAGAGPGLL